MLRSITSSVRALFRKKQLARELDLELREFLDMAADEKIRAGMGRRKQCAKCGSSEEAWKRRKR